MGNLAKLEIKIIAKESAQLITTNKIRFLAAVALFFATICSIEVHAFSPVHKMQFNYDWSGLTLFVTQKSVAKSTTKLFESNGGEQILFLDESKDFSWAHEYNIYAAKKGGSVDISFEVTNIEIPKHCSDCNLQKAVSILKSIVLVNKPNFVTTHDGSIENFSNLSDVRGNIAKQFNEVKLEEKIPLEGLTLLNYETLLNSENAIKQNVYIYWADLIFNWSGEELELDTTYKGVETYVEQSLGNIELEYQVAYEVGNWVPCKQSKEVEYCIELKFSSSLVDNERNTQLIKNLLLKTGVDIDKDEEAMLASFESTVQTVLITKPETLTPYQFFITKRSKVPVNANSNKTKWKAWGFVELIEETTINFIPVR